MATEIREAKKGILTGKKKNKTIFTDMKDDMII